MATLNISLPDRLRDWIDAQVAGGGYATASDFVRELVRDHQDYKLRLARLDELLREGEQSGISPQRPAEIIEDIIRRRADG